jgi:phosphatidylserine/phosphatidylglycerophosphate/cardiolipin synthase-like enzyme
VLVYGYLNLPCCAKAGATGVHGLQRFCYGQIDPHGLAGGMVFSKYLINTSFHIWFCPTEILWNLTNAREAVGVWHMKFYIFDDTIIISGANLSDTYFTNRQDRYVKFRSKALCDFYTNFLDALISASPPTGQTLETRV